MVRIRATVSKGITARAVVSSTVKASATLPFRVVQGETKKEKRHEFIDGLSFCGTAPLGTIEDAEKWKITRITVAADGSTTTATASNVAWTNRLTVNYI
jgi:hypothetical protein